VTALTITANGSGYTAAPTVTLSAPPVGGTQATATATLGKAVASITVTTAGAGYLTAPAVTLAAPPAGGTQATATATINNGAWTYSATSRTITFTLGATDVIGATASVYIVISAGITNPSTAGDYTLTVKTSQETTAVASSAYTIINPTVVTPPGIVKLYNSTGVLMDQRVGANMVKTLVDLAGAGYTVELGPGLYQEAAAITIVATTQDGLTIKASGALADTVVPVAWTINAKNVTFQGLTLKPSAAGGTVAAINGSGVKFDGCSFVKAGTATTAAAETFLTYNNATAATTGTITNCKFDTTLGAVVDTSIVVSAGSVGLTVSKNTFALDNTTLGAMDVAIAVSATCTISENTFTGASGLGITVAAGTATISKNTFTNLDEALDINGGSVVFSDNTADGCGLAISTTLTNGQAVIDDHGATAVTAFGNTIKNSKAYVAWSATGVGNWMFNQLLTNAKGFRGTVGTLNATHNWWGVATGPATGANSTTGVDASSWLGAVPSNGTAAIPPATLLEAKATAGVNLYTNVIATGVPAAPTLIGVASYATNPGAVAPASTYKLLNYFDAFVKGLTSGTDQITINFYGKVTASSKVLFWNEAFNRWDEVSNQGANVGGGYVWAVFNHTTTPALLALTGQEFALVDAPPPATGGVGGVLFPALGAVNIPIDTTFTWPAVASAVTYEFEIAEEIGQTDKFYLKDEVGSSAVSAFKLVDTLKYDTQYWWRVRAVDANNAKGAYTVSFFTTAKEPVVVVTPPPVVVTQTPPPQITLEIPPAQVTKVEPIPAYLLWAVIAVGAILVIAVIVLIVRTRRIS
jgi:hypothetical protein